MIFSVIIYALTFVISLFFINLYKKVEIKEYKKEKIIKILCLIGAMLPPILLAAFRYGVGVDFHTYVTNYNYFSNEFSLDKVFNSYQEPFSVILYFLAKVIFNNSAGFFLLSSLIITLFTVLGIKSYKNKISMTIALFIYYMFYYQISYNAVRQCIALAIVFFAYKYVIERKPIKYFIYVIVAGLFHKTAFICLIFYFLGVKKETKKSRVIDIILFVAVLLSPIIVHFAMKLVPYIIDTLGIYTSYVNKNVRRISM